MNDEMQPMTPPDDAGAADVPAEAPAEGADGAGGAKAREWLSQLETMIQSMATQAAPVARQIGAKAAELAAVAAVKAGPVAHKAADLTTDYGQRFAEKAQAVAAEWRATAASGPAEGEAPAVEPAEGEGHTPAEA